MKKGEIVEGKVKSVAFPNKGIVEVCDTNVRVKGVLPGQKVSVRIKKLHHGSPEGILLDVVEPSPVEVEADCPHFNVCGGCSYRTLPYEEQLKLKSKQVQDLLRPVVEACRGASEAKDTSVSCEEIGRFEDLYEGIFGSPIQEGYRNKMEFSFGDEYKDGPLSLGLHKRGSMYDIVPVTKCKIVDADYRAILSYTLEFFRERNVPYFHKVQHTGYLRHLLVRKSKKYGEILVALVTTSRVFEKAADEVESAAFESQRTSASGRDSLALDAMISEYSQGLQALQLEGMLTGIVHTVNDSVADVVKDEGSEVLFGRPYIREELLGLQFQISQFSFFQTNSLSAEVLYGKVREFLLGRKTGENGNVVIDKDAEKTEGAETGNGRTGVIYDLYSGTGTIAQLLAPVADKVVGVEIVEEAVEAARENAALNGLANCEFIAGDVLKVLDDLTEKPDMIILDPPRDGIHPKALPKIIGYGVERMVYVSCKPTSLARDLEVFMANGYAPTRICAVDQFPGTVHIETIALIERIKNAKDHIQIS